MPPEQTDIDPSLHHSTLIFPHVISDSSYDTGIAITNSFYEAGVTGRTAKLYLYDMSGQLRREVTVTMDSSATDPGVFPGYVDILSNIVTCTQGGRIANVVDYNPITGPFEGWILAVVNIPYANGYEFLDCPGVGILGSAGMMAQVDNNIYAVDDDLINGTRMPKRLGDPASSQTPIVLPFITNQPNGNPYQTLVTLTSTINQGDSVTADFYLYNMDGTLNAAAASWSATLSSANGMPETAEIIIVGNSIILRQSSQTDTLITNNLGAFVGWMLIIVHSPSAYATATLATSQLNQMDSYVGVCDPDIVGVDMSPNNYGNIRRANPIPIGPNSITQLGMPLVTTANGLETAIAIIVLRNRSEWPTGGGNVLYSYDAYYANGPSPIMASQSVPPGNPPGALATPATTAPPNDPFLLSQTNFLPGHTGAITAGINSWGGLGIVAISGEDMGIYVALPKAQPDEVEVTTDDDLHPGVDMLDPALPGNNLRSIYVHFAVKLTKDDKKQDTIILTIDKAPNTAGGCKFEGGKNQWKISGDANDTRDGVLVWLEGGAPSGPADGHNFTLVVNKNGVPQPALGPGIPAKWDYKFRVFNTVDKFKNTNNGNLPIVFQTVIPPGGLFMHTNPVPQGQTGHDPRCALQVNDLLMMSQSVRHPGDDPTFNLSATVTMQNPLPPNTNDFNVGVVQNLTSSILFDATYANPAKKSYYSYQVSNQRKLPFPLRDKDWRKQGNSPWFDNGTQWVNPQGIANISTSADFQEVSAPTTKMGQPGQPPQQLTRFQREEYFRAWLIVEYVNSNPNANDPDDGARERIYLVIWNIDWTGTVDFQAIPVAANSPGTQQDSAAPAQPMNLTGKVATAGPTPDALREFNLNP
jgi:hypothetical protein